MESKRSDAINAGDKYYDTGKKCRYGHYSKRLTIDGSCVECRVYYQKKTRDEIRQRISS